MKSKIILACMIAVSMFAALSMVPVIAAHSSPAPQTTYPIYMTVTFQNGTAVYGAYVYIYHGNYVEQSYGYTNSAGQVTLSSHYTTNNIYEVYYTDSANHLWGTGGYTSAPARLTVQIHQIVY